MRCYVNSCINQLDSKSRTRWCRPITLKTLGSLPPPLSKNRPPSWTCVYYFWSCTYVASVYNTDNELLGNLHMFLTVNQHLYFRTIFSTAPWNQIKRNQINRNSVKLLALLFPLFWWQSCNWIRFSAAWAFVTVGEESFKTMQRFSRSSKSRQLLIHMNSN